MKMNVLFKRIDFGNWKEKFSWSARGEIERESVKKKYWKKYEICIEMK